jgi:hypothetical protein
MPYYTSTKPIIAEALDLLTNQNRRATTQTNLKAVIDSLGTTSAAQQTAQMAMDMIDK